MVQRTLTADTIATAAVTVLENELIMANKVFRGYEEDFDKKVNGYEVGDTLTIRKPTDYVVRRGQTMALQDVVEGKTTITVDQQIGIDFKFSSKDLTLNIKDLTKRVIKPAMIQLANDVDIQLMALYKDIPSWQGATATTPINTYAKFTAGPQRMDEFANPTDERTGVLSPADYWALNGSQTGLFIQDAAKGAYRNGSLGMIGGVDTFQSQNVPTHITGTKTTGAVDQALTAATTTYDSVKDTDVQTIHMDGLGTNGTVVRGDVFTIAGVYAVNPVTKQQLSFLKQFTVTANVTADAVTTGDADVICSPALIWSGAFQNVWTASTDLNDAVVTWVGTANTAYRQNMVFHPNAFALVSVPMVEPPGAADCSRQTFKGTNVRVVPVYDGVNDVSKWRLDLLFGVKTIDKRLAHRMSGST